MHEIFSLIAYFYAKLGNSGKVSQPICLLGYAHASTSLKVSSLKSKLIEMINLSMYT